MTQKFKVGDKVRVVRTIYTAVSYGYRIGDIFEVKKVGSESIDTVDGHRLWYQEVEKVPKKSERISALESQVAELTAKVVALEKAVKPSIKFVDAAEVFIDGKLFGKLKTDEARVLSANEQRKAIIAEAKTFVADLTAYINPESGGYKQEHPKYGTISRKVYTYLSRVFFTVKSDTREVTVVIKRKNPGEITAKATAKCATDDVFNIHIGKAIALGRALGLDVKRFEHAVKPTEFTVGQIITFPKEDSWHMRHNYRIDKMKGDDALTVVFNSVEGLDYRVGKKASEAKDHNVIIEDTDAQY